eukprot:gnl/Spiro4/15495_TR8346_c0_g1_i1.p1 gnl/Spiro4/15495_TR8346_c0_g1~~gnl/Spiro4/15495_TR8346_c0_g1_i1.p1  ORF type:complete len:705 (-),score=212.90 gnl/Spiro4/15495_TR8346_c0_g1_i1:59-2149(-)
MKVVVLVLAALVCALASSRRRADERFVESELLQDAERPDVAVESEIFGNMFVLNRETSVPLGEMSCLGLEVDKSKALHVISADIEGLPQHFTPEAWAAVLEPEFGERPVKFVLSGDLCDQNSASAPLEGILQTVKESKAEVVFGNRDANKFRFVTELSPQNLDFLAEMREASCSKDDGEAAQNRFRVYLGRLFYWVLLAKRKNQFHTLESLGKQLFDQLGIPECKELSRLNLEKAWLKFLSSATLGFRNKDNTFLLPANLVAASRELLLQVGERCPAAVVRCFYSPAGCPAEAELKELDLDDDALCSTFDDLAISGESQADRLTLFRDVFKPALLALYRRHTLVMHSGLLDKDYYTNLDPRLKSKAFRLYGDDLRGAVCFLNTEFMKYATEFWEQDVQAASEAFVKKMRELTNGPLTARLNANKDLFTFENIESLMKTDPDLPLVGVMAQLLKAKDESSPSGAQLAEDAYRPLPRPGDGVINSAVPYPVVQSKDSPVLIPTSPTTSNGLDFYLAMFMMSLSPSRRGADYNSLTNTLCTYATQAKTLVHGHMQVPFPIVFSFTSDGCNSFTVVFQDPSAYDFAKKPPGTPHKRIEELAKDSTLIAPEASFFVETPESGLRTYVLLTLVNGGKQEKRWFYFRSDQINASIDPVVNTLVLLELRLHSADPDDPEHHTVDLYLLDGSLGPVSGQSRAYLR